MTEHPLLQAALVEWLHASGINEMCSSNHKAMTCDSCTKAVAYNATGSIAALGSKADDMEGGLALGEMPDDFATSLYYNPPPDEVAWTVVGIADRLGTGLTLAAAVKAAMEVSDD